MIYILKLIARDIKDNDAVFEGKSEMVLSYPIDGHFASHTIVGNALATLVPLLLGEVATQINAQAELSEQEAELDALKGVGEQETEAIEKSGYVEGDHNV